MPEKKIDNLIRSNIIELDNILGQPFKVLDDGFIRVVDYMGTDDSIVQAARVSYGKGTKKVKNDRSLIRYLMRHRHTTPFEMCEIKLHIRVPMDCWRQWIRHRTANVNEYSTRYSEAIDSRQKTLPSQWRLQDKINKQASSGFLEEEKGIDLSRREDEFHDTVRKVYEERLKAGIAREQARKDLPLSTYTEAYWKIDLHNLLHFLELRMESRAQFEIRSYANIIGYEIVKKWCPITWEAFLDYRLNAVSLSVGEQQIIASMEKGNFEEAINISLKEGFIDYDREGLIKKRGEGIEFEKKISRLNLSAPWNKK
jgi:thymidylate synthase (FAD)